MKDRHVNEAEFQADCLALIEQINTDNGTVTVHDKDGRPVAQLLPLAVKRSDKPFSGSMEGTVLWYDDPFEPAEDPSAWNANR